MPDVRKDPRYLADNPETRAELSVPLVYKGRVIGVIDLEHTRVNYYNEDHQRTLTTLASQVAISIVNARLYQRIHDEEQRMERDLGMAREVQLRLLPSAPPTPMNAEIAASFSPARSIGGDMYDFLDYGASPHPDLEDPDAEAVNFVAAPACLRTLIALGDVSGKAAPAALYAALVSGILRSLTGRKLGPAQLLAVLNDQLQERKLDAQYVRCGCWRRCGTMRIARCTWRMRGRLQPMLVTHGSKDLTSALKVTTLPVEGFPLGLFPHSTYDETCMRLNPGDMVLFFSDGIVDAINSRGEQFGSERLETLMLHHPTATDSAQDAVNAILEAVKTHQAGAEHFDDETIIVLRVR